MLSLTLLLPPLAIPTVKTETYTCDDFLQQVPPATTDAATESPRRLAAARAHGGGGGSPGSPLPRSDSSPSPSPSPSPPGAAASHSPAAAGTCLSALAAASRTYHRDAEGVARGDGMGWDEGGGRGGEVGPVDDDALAPPGEEECVPHLSERLPVVCVDRHLHRRATAHQQ